MIYWDNNATTPLAPEVYEAMEPFLKERFFNPSAGYGCARHVEKLIADDRYKQYEIAEMVGYKDFGYYIKVFKKRYGITPNEFRKHI